MHQSRDTKQFNSDGIAPMHAQSVALVSKHDPLKAFIQLPRNIKNRGIAHFTPYFAFFVILRSLLFCNLFCTGRVLKIDDFYFVTKL